MCISWTNKGLNSLNAEFNPICHLLALLGIHHIIHVSGIRINTINIRGATMTMSTKRLFLVKTEDCLEQMRD